jgi:hypothetical protein
MFPVDQMTVDDTINAVVNYLRDQTLSDPLVIKNAGRARVPKR